MQGKGFPLSPIAGEHVNSRTNRNIGSLSMKVSASTICAYLTRPFLSILKKVKICIFKALEIER